jgi:hypothetical protein
VVSFPVLFAGTVAGFVASALLVVTARLPDRVRGRGQPFLGRRHQGHPHLHPHPPPARADGDGGRRRRRGAMVYVNTVVLVQARLGLGEEAVALAFAGFGAGSMLAAFLAAAHPRPGWRTAR